MSSRTPSGASRSRTRGGPRSNGTGRQEKSSCRAGLGKGGMGIAMTNTNATGTLSDPDADLQAVWSHLDRAGVLDDLRKDQEPFRSFVRAYNDLQSAVCRNASAEAIERHRHAGRAAAFSVAGAEMTCRSVAPKWDAGVTRRVDSASWNLAASVA